MDICGKREFELLKRIGFTRVAGSDEELRAAEILKAECDEMGVPAIIEPFTIEDAEIQTAELEILEPFKQTVEVTGYKCAANTYGDGLTADFIYVENATEVNLANARDKIVLVNGYMRVPLFKKLMEAGVAGIVTMEGDILDKNDETDLSTRKLRRALRTFGNVPMVNMRIKDALEIVRNGATRARLALRNTVVEKTSHNVIATVKGTEKPEEIVSFGAHYDSVDFSTGVFDNGAGSVINMEVLRWYKENPPKRTVKFMWYGSEEIGLEGSWAYVKSHQDELKDHRLMINTDVGGPILGVDGVMVTAEEKLATYMEYFLKINNFSAEVKQDIYSSDCIPFADSGVPAVNFVRGGTEGSAHIHDRNDVIDFLSPEMLAKTTAHVLEFSKAVVNSGVFPVERKIPDNIKEKVEKYLYKKELAEAAEKQE